MGALFRLNSNLGNSRITLLPSKVAAITQVIPHPMPRRNRCKLCWRSSRGHRTRKLLRMMILQAGHAADNGVSIELEPLKMIFESEGLFAIVEKGRLAQHVRDLWKAAERHNTGLDRPSGAQRSDDLRRAVQVLSERLDMVDDLAAAARQSHLRSR